MNIVIQGAGAVGSHLAKMLRDEGNYITVIDNDEQRLSSLSSRADIQALEGNPSSIKVLRDAGVGQADLFIAVYPSTSQEMNIVGALLAKHLGAAKVLARVNDEDYLDPENKLLFKEMGIELMFYPEKIASDEIVSQIKNASFAESMDFGHGKLQIALFKLDENSPLLDYKLVEFMGKLPKEESEQFRIIAITRGEKTLIPKFDTVFQYGDMLYVISRREGLDVLIKYFGKTNTNVENVLIGGGNPIAEMVAKSLIKKGIGVKLIEIDKQRCIELSEDLPNEVEIVKGDCRNTDLLVDEGIHNYDVFLALTGEDETNILSSVVAKKLGVPKTIAEVENFEYTKLAEEMGIDSVINKKLITASRIFKFTLNGRARLVKYMSGTDAEVIEYTVAPGSAITKKPLKDLEFPKSAVIGGVIRGSDAFIAVGSTKIEAYDRVAIFTKHELLKEIDKFFK